MASLLTYISVVGLTLVWLLGWMGMTLIIGAFFDLPVSTTALVGLTLGPLGVIVVILVGITERIRNSPTARGTLSMANQPLTDDAWDPFV